MAAIGVLLLLCLAAFVIYAGVILLIGASLFAMLIWVSLVIMGVATVDPSMAFMMVLALVVVAWVVYHKLVVEPALAMARKAKLEAEHQEYLERKANAPWYDPRYW